MISGVLLGREKGELWIAADLNEEVSRESRIRHAESVRYEGKR